MSNLHNLLKSQDQFGNETLNNDTCLRVLVYVYAHGRLTSSPSWLWRPRPSATRGPSISQEAGPSHPSCSNLSRKCLLSCQNLPRNTGKKTSLTSSYNNRLHNRVTIDYSTSCTSLTLSHFLSQQCFSSLTFWSLTITVMFWIACRHLLNEMQSISELKTYTVNRPQSRSSPLIYIHTMFCKFTKVYTVLNSTNSNLREIMLGFLIWF